MAFSLPAPLSDLTTLQQLVVGAVLAAATATVYGAIWWYRRTTRPVFKPVGKVSEIWIHPIKSCRGLKVSSAECTPAGLYSNGLYDRYEVPLTPGEYIFL